MFCMVDFFFPTRLHRLSYLLRLFLTNGVVAFLEFYRSIADTRIWIVCWTIAVVYQVWFIVLPRIRDLGLSAWWALLLLVPIVDIIFSLILAFRAPVIKPPSNTPSPETVPA